MRIVQDITIAVLLDVPIVELPLRVYTRENCDVSSVNCSKIFKKGSLFSNVFDLERTVSMLKMIGVTIQPRSSKEKIESVHLQWPIAASQLSKMSSKMVSKAQRLCSKSDNYCSLADHHMCCTLLIPDTSDAVQILKFVNYAFQSAQTFKDEAAKVIDLFKKKTRQDLVITMHWRLDEDFIESKDHKLSPSEYCEGMLGGLELLLNRTLSHHTTTTTTRLTNLVHVIVLGAFEVEKVKTFLDSCSMKRNSHPIGRLYEFHSKETLLSKSDSTILSGVETDVKGQLDFELGSVSDFFLGSPFSSFSVLIAFYRYSSPNYNPVQTIMAEVDVKDHLARLFEVQFPFSHEFEEDKLKCTKAFNSSPEFFHGLLSSCAAHETLTEHSD